MVFMKAIFLLTFIVGILAFGILEQSGLLTVEILEELLWLLGAICLFNYLYCFMRLRFISAGFLLYILGLFFDFVEHLPIPGTRVFDTLDTIFKNGGFFLIGLSMFRVIQEKKKFIIQLRFEIQQKNKLQKKLEHAAFHDELTGLPNRKALFKRLEKQRADAITILYCDLDKFKAANDQHGHVIGDKLLKQFATNLQQKFGIENSYRLGGDEFIALYHLQFNENELITLRQELAMGLSEFKVGVSFGHHQLLPDETPDHGLHEADIMMYRDKTTREEQTIRAFPKKYRKVPREDST